MALVVVDDRARRQIVAGNSVHILTIWHLE
jgi:hypothetical protein